MQKMITDRKVKEAGGKVKRDEKEYNERKKGRKKERKTERKKDRKKERQKERKKRATPSNLLQF